MRRASLIVLPCLLAVGLAACGEKDETAATEAVEPPPATTTTTAEPGETAPSRTEPEEERRVSPKEQVARIVETVIGGGDPAASCADLVTPRYVRSAYGDEQGCRHAVSQQSRFQVKVQGVEIEQEGVGANAFPQGGPNKGERLEVRLKRDGRSYRVDSAVSNAPAGP